MSCQKHVSPIGRNFEDKFLNKKQNKSIFGSSTSIAEFWKSESFMSKPYFYQDGLTSPWEMCVHPKFLTFTKYHPKIFSQVQWKFSHVQLICSQVRLNFSGINKIPKFIFHQPWTHIWIVMLPEKVLHKIGPTLLTVPVMGHSSSASFWCSVN